MKEQSEILLNDHRLSGLNKSNEECSKPLYSVISFYH